MTTRDQMHWLDDTSSLLAQHMPDPAKRCPCLTLSSERVSVLDTSDKEASAAAHCGLIWAGDSRARQHRPAVLASSSSVGASMGWPCCRSSCSMLHHKAQQ